METDMKIQQYLPMEIEERSFAIISEELDAMGIELEPENELVIKRAIHTSADFEYAHQMTFSDHAVNKAIEIMKQGCTIITDTNMGKSGVNKKACEKLGITVECFMADEDVAAIAKANGTTRAVASMDKASQLEGNLIFAIGNAPTALIRLYELIEAGKINPALIIGVPVGFVNVVESKELIMTADVDYIVAQGRKGGSNIAAAICNALLYQATTRE